MRANVLLVGLQLVVTWSSVRVRWVGRLVTGEPKVLLRRGRFLAEDMRCAGVTEDEVRAAVRAAGCGDLRAVDAVVLETDGSFGVIHGTDRSPVEDAPMSSLQGLPPTQADHLHSRD